MNTFEENMARLEELSEKIRNPEIGIEDALSTFEEGIRLAKTLENEIEKIEGKIQILMNSPLDEKQEAAETSKEQPRKQQKKNEQKKAEEKQAATEDDGLDDGLEFDLFEEQSAPSEGLRQNG
nr:exodeoxyribonuclease VII small subunit [Treponema sp.]